MQRLYSLSDVRCRIIKHRHHQNIYKALNNTAKVLIIANLLACVTAVVEDTENDQRTSHFYYQCKVAVMNYVRNPSGWFVCLSKCLLKKEKKKITLGLLHD